MERTISAEERIKRAEEIYQKRKMQGGIRVSTSNVNSKKQPEYRLFKKLILQVIICLLIYFIFYLIQNSNYIFSKNVINGTKEFLTYDINFQNVFNQIGNYYNENIAVLFNKKEEEQEISNNDIVNEIMQEESGTTNKEEVVNEVVNETVNENANEAVLSVSADEEQSKEEKVEIQEQQPLTQMEIDANEIKANYSFILPLKGTITSRYGPRTATGIVSANHAGIDIAANEGTIFIAAMEGTVTEISTERWLWKPCLYKKW